MAWSGGGGMWGGFGRGGIWRGPSGQSDLPFAGIPPELQDRVDEVLEKEPEQPEIKVEFSHHQTDRRPFTLRRFIAPHWLALLLGTLLVGIEVVAEQAGPMLTQVAIDRGILPRRFSIVVIVVAVYLVSILLNVGVRTLRTAWTGRVGERLLYELRIRVFSHLQRLSLDFYTREKAGVVMTRMTSDIDALQQLLHDGLINLVVQGITLLFVTAVLFAYNAKLALVVVVVIVPLMVAATLWFRASSDRAFRAVRERIADVLGDLAESLAGIRIAAMYNRQRHNSVKHRNVVGRHFDANLQAARISGAYSAGVEGIGALSQVLILVVGGTMVLNRSLTPGELAAFLLYLGAFFAPIQQLVQLYNVYQQGRAAIFKISGLLDERPSVPESARASVLPLISGRIEFSNVTFGYQHDRPVLSDVSLSIAAGETFALVGPTGAGKSTIAKLITRFYDPDGGRVLIDGHDIQGVSLKSLRTQLGVVPQEPFLFAGSMRDNIAFSRPDADTKEVLEACRAVGIEDLIHRLPQGLDTPCHERGITLSSGERQLIALARAFMAQPRVIILDEATSNLDLGTEAKLEHALDILLEGRTAILIAHRLSTAMRADRIAVIDGGRVVEVGSHAELVSNDGLYARMIATWLRHGLEPAQIHQHS